jgi:hypothetical protein
MRTLFDVSKISDQKRLVRGEHYLHARTILRARDQTHHKRWRILTLAGGTPAGEIGCIRELMPKAQIVAVDRNQACLEAAIEAGADDVIHADLTNWAVRRRQEERWNPDSNRREDVPVESLCAAAPIAALAPYDIINLDLCGGVNQTTRDIVARYLRLLAPAGVFIITFSYGRDVVEVFQALWEEIESKAGEENDDRWSPNHNRTIFEMFSGAGVPPLLVGRLRYLFVPTQMEKLRSVMAYRGNEMPMCSALYVPKRPKSNIGLSFVQVGDRDLEPAVMFPDAARLYDCPKERIDAFRRSFAAQKAVATRRVAIEAKQLLFPAPEMEITRR